MMFRRYLPLLTLVALGASGLASASGQTPQIPWRSDLGAARQEAAQSGRNLLVHFWAPWCGPCRRLETVVFNQPDVASAMRQGLIPVKLNADEFPQIATAYGVDRLPTDVVLRPDGTVLGKFASPQDPAAYLAQIAPFAMLNRATSGLPDHQFAGSAAGTASHLPMQTAYAHLNASRGAVQTHQFPTGPQTTGAYQAAPNGYDSMAGANYRDYGMSASTVETVPLRSSPTSGGSREGLVPTTVAHEAARLPTEPSSQALGLDGFCPVTLKNEQRWIPGDKRFGIYHRGSLYLFTGPQQQQQFWANPDGFSPVLSGLDPVLALDNGASVQGQREHGVEYGGLVYLFSSESTLQHFSRNPERYAGGVRQAMQGGAGNGRTLR